jgi:2-C-methyl-D-erythritol 4-phosphate cytidylyltransferase
VARSGKEQEPSAGGLTSTGDKVSVAAFALLADGGTRRPPLALAPVNGESLYLWSLRSLQARVGVSPLVLLVPPRVQVRVMREVQVTGHALAVVPVAGTSAGTYLWTLSEMLRLLPLSITHVGLHDVTIPVVDAECWAHALAGVDERTACVAAQPVHDTIKLAGSDGVVRGTPPRGDLRSIQTPLVATPLLLRRVLYELAPEEIAPDEPATGWLDHLVAQIASSDGARLRVVPAGPNSLPVRSPGDLSLAGSWIAASGSTQA